LRTLKKFAQKKLVLISTADVYACPDAVDETTVIDETALHPYGKNRYYLEKWVADNSGNYHIVRLPGLFGDNLKKNLSTT
jgi:nucleoside-diphosphate-sugar epimerase